MRKTAPLLILILAACGGTESTREVSRTTDGAHPQGMSYKAFRAHSMNDGADSLAVQKRFLLLDRDNNGVLSASEFSDY